MRVEQTSPARGLWTWCLGIMTLALCVSLGPNQALASPTITSPTPGTPLPGSTTTFAWEAGGAAVTEWWLYVGTSPGAADLYDSASLGSRIIDTINGLPTDGSTVHVRLWYRINGAWPFTDFTYTTSGSPGRLSAVPPWDQVLPSAKRFVRTLEGSAVLDKNTGLVWVQRPSLFGETYTWSQAILHCLRTGTFLHRGAVAGWHLPSVYELKSLQDPSLASPFVPENIFSDVQNAYWSATVDPMNPDDALVVGFALGAQGAPDIEKVNKSSSATRHVWCVRGAM